MFPWWNNDLNKVEINFINVPTSFCSKSFGGLSSQRAALSIVTPKSFNNQVRDGLLLCQFG
jgi:hypothetical protein